MLENDFDMCRIQRQVEKSGFSVATRLVCKEQPRGNDFRCRYVIDISSEAESSENLHNYYFRIEFFKPVTYKLTSFKLCLFVFQALVKA